MIYKRIDIIPYKTLLEILSSNNLRLLVTDDTDISDEELKEVWENLHKDYIDINPSLEEQKIMKIHKEIYFHEAKYNLVIVSCKILAFDYDEDSFRRLRGFGYKITREDYLQSIDIIERQAEGLLVKVEAFKLNLPPENENSKYTVDDILASYCAILQIHFDFNTIPASAAIALGKQVDLKIKSFQKSMTDGK